MVVIEEARDIDVQALRYQLSKSEFVSVHLLGPEIAIRVEARKERRSIRRQANKSREEEITLGIRRRANGVSICSPDRSVLRRSPHQSSAGLGFKVAEVCV